MSDDKLAILYLDDSEVQLGDVVRTLAKEGYEVRVATTVTEAIRKLNGVDLVMIDFHMPDADGADALQRLRHAVGNDSAMAYYLYTSDRNIATSYKRLGFDGAFVEKGDSAALPAQVQAANRMLQLRRLRLQRQKT